MSQPQYTAWVLGAGFSYSLGGPLLAHFFSPSLGAALSAALQHKKLPALDRDALKTLSNIYFGPDGAKHAVLDPTRPWRDPEQFLILLNEAAEDSSSRARGLFNGLGYSDLEKLWRAATAYVTLATDIFVPANAALTKDLENWQPYRRWARHVVDATDVVISFNYDRVPELASDDRLKANTPDLNFQEVHRPWYLKLHGSVTFRNTGSGVVRDDERSGLAMLAESLDVAIGVPGRAKYQRNNTSFRPLWDAATDILKTARRIVFLGFRFPPGDAGALQELLGAIGENNHRELQVDVVLGPNVHAPDVVRMRRLLEWALMSDGRRNERQAAERVRVEPLFAEDYLALFKP